MIDILKLKTIYSKSDWKENFNKKKICLVIGNWSSKNYQIQPQIFKTSYISIIKKYGFFS